MTDAGGGPHPTDDATTRFRTVAGRVLDAMLELSPEWATEQGDHRFDDRLADLSAEGVAHAASVLGEAAAALDDLDDTDLEADDRVDLEVLRAAVTERLWIAQELRPHESDPLVHLPVDGLHVLLDRPGPDPVAQVVALTARLAAVPERLAVARDVLGPMARVHVETAIGQARGLCTALDEVPEADGVHAASALARARASAVAALEDHVRWLEDRLPLADADPRLGPERYAARLWYALDDELGPDALLTRAESDLQAVEERVAEVASRIAGRPSGPGLVREVLDQLAAEAPVDDASVLSLCSAAVADATRRMHELDLVTVPEDPVAVRVMPPARRGVAVAYCETPGPLEEPGAGGRGVTVFAVSPTPSGWPRARVDSFYREYNGHMLRDLAVHEAVPGHALQLAHGAAHRGATRVRRALASGAFVEGWAVYAEQLVAGHGWRGDGGRDDDAFLLHQLKMQLRSTINAILDVRVHARGMTEEEALRLMVQRGHQEEGEAVGKWRRALLTSAQLATYYVGFRRVDAVLADLRTDRPGAVERDLHDAVLAHGAPPPRHLRSLLGLDRDG